MPPKTTTLAQIGNKPDVDRIELSINKNAKCNARECQNHFIVRVRQQCKEKTLTVISDRKELIVQKSTPYFRLTVGELFVNVKEKHAHLDDIKKRVKEGDKSLKDYETIPPFQKDINTNDIQLKN